MNHLKLRRELENQMYLYIAFLPTINFDNPERTKQETETMIFKLLDEIQFLKLRILQINRMNVNQAYSPVRFVKNRITAKF